MYDRLLILGYVLILLTKSEIAAGGMLVKNADTPLYAEASKTSAVLIKMPAGSILEDIDRKGMFWHVKLNGADGYVSVLSVQRHSVSGGSIDKLIQQSVIEGRATDPMTSSRTRSAVMGVRGLDEGNDLQGAGQVQPDLKKVYRMEDMQLSPHYQELLDAAIRREIEFLNAQKQGPQQAP